jgi:hypothetical protein
MPRYRLLAPHVIDGAVREIGYEVELDYEPSLEMEPLDAAGKKALAAFKDKLAGLHPVDANQGDTLRYRLWTATLVREHDERSQSHGQRS